MVSYHHTSYDVLGHIKVIILDVTGRVCDLLQANVPFLIHSHLKAFSVAFVMFLMAFLLCTAL